MPRSVFVFALIIGAAVSLHGQGKPSKPTQTEQPAVSDNSTKAESETHIPQVNVTVVNPQPSPEEKKKDDARRDSDSEVQRRMSVANERMVAIGWVQVVAALLVFLITWRALGAAIASAKAAERSAEAAVMSVAAEQRAWVGFEIEIATPLIFDSVYTKPPKKGWHFEFRYVLTHSGKTPALNVAFHVRAEPWITMSTKPGESPVLGTDIEKLRHSVTYALREVADDFRARTIFPGSPPQDGRQGAVVHDERVIAAREAGYHWTGQFIVVASVTYRTLAGEWHFSDKVLHIGRKNGKPIDLNGPTIQKDEIGLNETSSHYGRAT